MSYPGAGIWAEACGLPGFASGQSLQGYSIATHRSVALMPPWIEAPASSTTPRRLSSFCPPCALLLCCAYAPLVHFASPCALLLCCAFAPFVHCAPPCALLLCCTFASLVHSAPCARCCCAAPTLPWYIPPCERRFCIPCAPLTGGMLCFPVFPESQALQAHGGEKVRCMAMGGNGVLYTGGDDHLIRAWSPHTLEPLPDFEPLRVSGKDTGMEVGGRGWGRES